MTAPPVNSDEDYYMDESFDEESLSEVEEEQEDDVLDDGSDSRSDTDTDVEAEFLRGNVSATKQDQPQELIIKQFSLNSYMTPPTPTTLPQPHARRHQIFGKRTGGGSGFARENIMKYPSSSSEDETQVVITKTVAEVNELTLRESQAQIDDETMSVRTLVPSINGNPDSGGQTELEDNDGDDTEMEEMMGEEEETDSDNDDGNSLVSEQSDEEAEDVKVGQLEDDEQENENEENNEENQEPEPKNQDLVDVEDASDQSEMGVESEAEQCSQHSSDDEIEFVPALAPQKMKRLPRTFPNLLRKPVISSSSVDVPPLPKLEDVIREGAEPLEPDFTGIDTTEAFNVKYLEQQMTQMSEMIMKTFRLSGGSKDNTALEQLALATELMKKNSQQKTEMESEGVSEVMSTPDSPKSPCKVHEEKLSNRKCRCPSDTDDVEPQKEPFFMDECGQGDGLLRFPPNHIHESHSHRVNCRVSSVTPTSFNSDNCGYHIDVARARSATSTERFNYKNVGRKSFSFTNPQVREIERQNNILLKKMMHVKPTIKPTINSVKSATNLQAKPPAPRLTSAAVNRKKYQRQIDLDNDVLKRKLEAVGSRRPIFK